MMGWLARWFGKAPAREVSVHVDEVAPRAPAAVDPDAAPSAAQADLLFYRLIAGAAGADETGSAEQPILDELARLAQSPAAAADLVPRVPAVIPQLLRSLRDDSMSAADLSRQVAQDVVLVAEVIREANSPYYRPAAPVKTIEGALMLLGQNGLRMLLARVAFRPVISMQSGRFARQAAPHVWAQSERCAQAASLVAPAWGANPFEAYLAGLMQNVGLIVAFRAIDQVLLRGELPSSPAFCAQLLARARTLSAAIAREWDFPATVAAAIAQPYAAPLGEALGAGDRLAKLRLLADAGVITAGAARDGLDPAQQRCFDKLQDKDD